MTVDELLKALLDSGSTISEEDTERRNVTMVYLLMTKDGGKTHSTFRVPASKAAEFVIEREKEGWKPFDGTKN